MRLDPVLPFILLVYWKVCYVTVMEVTHIRRDSGSGAASVHVRRFRCKAVQHFSPFFLCRPCTKTSQSAETYAIRMYRKPKRSDTLVNSRKETRGRTYPTLQFSFGAHFEASDYLHETVGDRGAAIKLPNRTTDRRYARFPKRWSAIVAGFRA